MALPGSQSRSYVLILALIFVGAFSTSLVNAQEAPASPSPSATIEESKPTHKFWDKENGWLFAGVAASRALDYTSTRNMLARGREEILIPDDVVNSRAGFPALEAAGTATSIGISYIFHHYQHHKLERWVSIVHIGVTTFGAVHNYALDSHHP